MNGMKKYIYCSMVVVVIARLFFDSMAYAAADFTNPAGSSVVYQGTMYHGGEYHNYTNYGTVTAKGSETTDSIYGLNLTGNFTNSGTVYATGGSGGYAYGMSLRANATFTNSGTVYATGGSGSRAYGMFFFLDAAFTNSGTVYATGGSGSRAYGIYFSPNATFTNSGTLVLQREGSADSINFVDNCHLLLSSGSTLALAGGPIVGETNDLTVTVGQGAKLISLATAGLATNQPVTYTDFLTGASSFNHAEFAPVNNITLSRTITNAGGNYTAAFTRIATPSSVLSGSASDLMAALEQLVAPGVNHTAGSVDPALIPYAMLFAHIDHQPTFGAMQSTADTLNKELSTQGTASAIFSLTNITHVATDLFVGKFIAATSSPPSGDEPLGVSLWAQPFYHYGELNGTGGNSDITDTVAGISFGGIKATGPWVFGFGGHVLVSELDGGREYDADVAGFGFNAGLGRSFSINDWFTPFVQLTLGYSHFDIEQTRTMGILSSIMPTGRAAKYESDPNMDVYSASLHISNSFEFGSMYLTPRIGVEYAHAELDGYSEKATVPGTEAFAWKVGSTYIDSFRSVVGFTFGVDVSSQLYLEARGDYYHEFADTYATLNARSKDIPFSFKADGQDMGRDSFRVGAGISWFPTERASFTLNYDFTGADQYQGHDVALQAKIEF